MLDSRFLGVPGHQQSLGSFIYNAKILVMRKQITDGHMPNDGMMGSTTLDYVQVVRGLPASIVPSGGTMDNYPAGQTELADEILTIPYRLMSDNGLIVRERDVVINLISRRQFLVLWSHNPNDAGVQIVAGLQYGVVNIDLSKQS